MPAEVEYRPDGEYVYVKVQGELVTERAVEMIQHWMALETQHACRKVLTDCRMAELVETITGMYEFVSKMDSLGIPRDMKMACVARRNTEDHVFFETVAQNQGWLYQLFEGLDEAVAWLTED